MRRLLTRKVLFITLGLIVCTGILLSFPTILTYEAKRTQEHAFSAMDAQFPVTVHPVEKSIIEDPQVEAYLDRPGSPLQAAVGNVWGVLADLFAALAVSIADSPWYERLAGAAGSTDRLISLSPGMRKEQVAANFANVLHWTLAQKKEFLTPSPYSSLPLIEGSFPPGLYALSKDTTPKMAQALINDRFSKEVLARYGTSTAQIVPLQDALTIASLIEREAGGPEDRRIISGIIWNRLFSGMHLQIDATLQYAKANALSSGSWWPRLYPADQFRKSPYNTYLHAGLPPAPIANPSIASVLAALNPRKTSCLFYFHDALGGFHCSETYAEHVSLLKKYYGRGK